MKANLFRWITNAVLVLAFALCTASCDKDKDKDEEKEENNGNVSGVVSNHGYVDLGLPSGTLWAACNIGARKPEEYGKEFSWGETQTKEVFLLENYKWADPNNAYKLLDTLKLFNLGVVDNVKSSYVLHSISSTGDDYYEDTIRTVGNLTAKYDAATANWGNSWRMPTSQEFNELITECKHTLTVINDVTCLQITGKNGNSILFPIKPSAYDFNFGEISYLSSSLSYYEALYSDGHRKGMSNCDYFWLYVTKKNDYTGYVIYNAYGLPRLVRPVLKK